MSFTNHPRHSHVVHGSSPPAGWVTSVVTSGVGQTYDDPADVHRQVTSRGRIQSRSLYCTEEVIPYDSSALKSCTGPPNTYSVQPNLISPLKGVHGAHGATLRFADVHPNLKEQMANNNKARASALPVRRPPGAEPILMPQTRHRAYWKQEISWWHHPAPW
jgi:hypothetical protein